MTTRRAPDDELRLALDELKAEFGTALPARLDELATAVSAAHARPDDSAAWDEAHLKAHRLHGTSGSYGFVRVGEVARQIELGLEATRSDDAAVRERGWHSVNAALADLIASPSSVRSPSLPVPVSPSGPSVSPPSIVPRDMPRLLVVDDDPDFLRHLELLARQQLFVVRTARTADDALEVARTERVDAALVDAHLDASSSFELARNLRARVPGLSLAFVSADEGVATRVAAAHAGATVFLSKPLGIFELTSALRSLLVERRTARPKVLIVDDDPAFSALATAILVPHEIETVTEANPLNVLEGLDQARPDLLLVDVHMPRVNGIDVCRTVRMTPRWRALPVLVLTRDSSLETRMAAFEAGADDYLLKPVVPQELSSRVRVRIERARFLHEMTHVDPLTRLLSRRAFLEALAPRVSDALRHHHPLSIALLDVDHFKRVNDVHGHAAGDRVLAGLGELLTSCFRLEDLRCRWGGEEFVVAFPGESAATIGLVLERVLAEMQRLEFAGADGTPFHVSFSAGVACLPEDGEGTESLMKVADKRLYAAKAAGRARIVAR